MGDKPCNNCVSPSDYTTDNAFTWCTNCGNYGIWGALRSALVEEDIPPKDVLLVNDIGCNGNGSDFINGYGFKGLHGRALPLACGASLANDKVHVIASAGDGAVLAEGIGHLIHAVRSNYNLTFLIHNNHNFALTTGQASPSTPPNVPMSSSPDGTTAEQINILGMMLPLKPSFAARGFSGQTKNLTKILREAINHKGFSLVEIMQYCPTYNKAMPHSWYNERVYDIGQKKGYDNSNLTQALEVANDMENKIATGVIYKDKWATDYYSKQVNRDGINTQLVQEVTHVEIDKLLADLR